MLCLSDTLAGFELLAQADGRMDKDSDSSSLDGRPSWVGVDFLLFLGRFDEEPTQGVHVGASGTRARV